MSNRLIALHLLFLGTLIGLSINALFGLNPWLSIVLVASSIALALIILRNWMSLIHRLLTKSNKVLNKPIDKLSAWSLANIDDLELNQDLAAKKFEASAELIANLSQPEKVGSMEDLVANDPIGKALKQIRTEMKRLKDEDSKQAWIAQGLAKFSSILRNKAEVKEYSNQIISNLVKYIGANQGGLFIEQQTAEKERYIELVACYAYEKRKYLENKIYEGQGLLGQCMLEKDFIFLIDIPKDYIKITSGLGLATPRNIIVAPLIFNDTFYGAIELALFDVLQPHQVEFIKKVSEDIASEIASMKTIAQTQELLNESRELTGELQTREEEMKQNLEELAATQEEMARKQVELTGVIKAIDSTLATAEFDATGLLVKYNSNLQTIFGYSHEELKSQNFNLIIGYDRDIAWHSITNGQIKSGDFLTKTNQGIDVWLSATFTPITDASGQLIRILSLIQDITLKKTKEQEFKRLSLVANNTDNSVIITDRDGITQYVNSGFTKMTGYESHHIIGKKPGKLLQGPLTDRNTEAILSAKIKEGVSINEEILNYNSKGETYWVSLAISPVRNEQGELIQFISIQTDITETKIKSLDFHQKMQALGRSNAIIEIDITGTIQDINENYLNILGYQKHEVVGKPYSLLTGKNHIFNKMLETVRVGGLQSGEFGRLDKQGRRHCMKLMDYPVLNLLGEIEKIIEFGVDITNEKRLQQEADHKKAELNSYLAGINNTIASASFDLRGNFTEGNDIFQKVMGYTSAELEGKCFDFLMGDDPNVIMMWESLKLGKFFSGEFKMKNKEGKDLWLTGTFNPIIVEGSSPEKIMMLAQFTTQEKEKLNDLNTMAHALKATLPVIEFTDTMACKTASEKALKIFGLSRVQLKNKTILDFIAPHYKNAWIQKQSELLDAEHLNLILPIATNEQSVNYEVSFSVAKNLEGKVAKVIMILIKELPEQVSILSTI